MRAAVWMALGLGVVISAAIVLSGCDSAEGVSGLQVSPSSVTLSGSNNTVILTAAVSSDLALPLVWTVANPSLGTVNYSSGSNAIYIANSQQKGNQVVMAEDQHNNQGSVSIVQQ